jgi:hypothetical protein
MHLNPALLTLRRISDRDVRREYLDRGRNQDPYARRGRTEFSTNQGDSYEDSNSERALEIDVVVNAAGEVLCRELQGADMAVKE